MKVKKRQTILLLVLIGVAAFGSTVVMICKPNSAKPPVEPPTRAVVTMTVDSK